MNKQKLQAMAEELAKDVKTPEDLGQLSAFLTKLTVEAALKGEMDHHLGYGKNDPEGHHSGNSRNGHSSKILKGDHGEIEIQTPRDRNASFEPRLIKKGQSRVTGMDDQILSLYARGMSTRDIVGAFQDMYGAEISAGLVSQVTNAVMEQVVEWQSRPLDAVYPNAINATYPGAKIQPCIVHMVRNSLKFVPWKDYKELTADLKRIYQSMTEQEGSEHCLSPTNCMQFG